MTAQRSPGNARVSALRIVRPEILDELAPEDPLAERARADLRRINRIMRSAVYLERALAPLALRGRAEPLRILELGAGDGTLMLRLAGRLARSGPPGEITLLDRHVLLSSATVEGFARLGWRVRALTLDVLEWTQAARAERWDAIIANLFLHHFTPAALGALLAAAAERCPLFVACEPRRSALSLAASHLLGAVGASRVTRHDAVASVHAGFRGTEISDCWPCHRQWALQEHRAGAFCHLFCARRACLQ